MTSTAITVNNSTRNFRKRRLHQMELTLPSRRSRSARKSPSQCSHTFKNRVPPWVRWMPAEVSIEILTRRPLLNSSIETTCSNKSDHRFSAQWTNWSIHNNFFFIFSFPFLTNRDLIFFFFFFPPFLLKYSLEHKKSSTTL